MEQRRGFHERLQRVRNWLFSAPCALCGVAISHGSDLCDGCERSLPTLIGCWRCGAPLAGDPQPALCGACQQRPPQYVGVHSAFRYAPPVDRLVQGGKYGGRLDWLELLGRRLAQRVAARRASVDALVVVPLHTTRLRTRGYNQSLELARPLMRAHKLPLVEGLIRVRETPPQAQLSSAERRRNVRDAFAATRDYAGLRLALVDDVMTSGATVEAVTRCLLRARAASVEVWVAARA